MKNSKSQNSTNESRFATMNNVFFQHPYKHVDPRDFGSARREASAIPGYQGHTPQTWHHISSLASSKWNGKLVEDTRFDLPGYTGFRPKNVGSNSGKPRLSSDRTTYGREYGLYSDRIH